MTSLAEALQVEIKRVREDVMPPYLEIGAPGSIAVAHMNYWLDVATKALAESDVIQCAIAYEELKGFET